MRLSIKAYIDRKVETAIGDDYIPKRDVGKFIVAETVDIDNKLASMEDQAPDMFANPEARFRQLGDIAMMSGRKQELGRIIEQFGLVEYAQTQMQLPTTEG